MYFNKYPYPANFDFVSSLSSTGAAKIGKQKLSLSVDSFEDDVFRIRVVCDRWKKNYSQANLTPPSKRGKRSSSGAELKVLKGCGFELKDARGRVLLSSSPKKSFGISGDASMFLFHHKKDHQYYGMGEKVLGLELSGRQTKFWNTDVFADFDWGAIGNANTDPFYASIPYVIVKRKNTYVGLLMNNPHAVFMSTNASVNIASQMDLGQRKEEYLTIGSEFGQPDLFIIVGPSLQALTQKLQRLVGVTPLPPAWALGYHQCRWGYKSESDLNELDAKFTEHGIPCDGLWLDIDYMTEYKVFSTNSGHFKNFEKAAKKLADRGRKVVPIIDPGVKKLKGYDVYDDGKKAGAFCLNPQGKEFVGQVWPGETVFPDFSLKKARAWWAGHVKTFLEQGIEGVWIDMNDPSTGSVLNSDMLFDKGRLPHHAFHNQYALGMAKATRKGFLKTRPNQRPFILSRSGSTGMSQHSAMWTGDNLSSYEYLRKSIPTSLNLSLSGVPFNGPDVGGFCGDCTDQLLKDWMKACFLFPFCRNHTVIGSKDQEPWAFSKSTLRVVREFIRARYAFRPYLYNLFVQQEESGEAILRPLFYDFNDSAKHPLGWIEDQFMVGPSIMQAPILSEHDRAREVLLPGKQRWYSMMDGTWLDGDRRIRVEPKDGQTPVYIRAGSILPLSRENPASNVFHSSCIDAHIFLKAGSRQRSTYEYVFDDGISYDYRNGKRSRVKITAAVNGKTLSITTKTLKDGFGPLDVRFILYDDFETVLLNGKPRKSRAGSGKLAGSRQKIWKV